MDGVGAFDLIMGDGAVAYMSLSTTDNATALKIRNYSGNSDIATFERTTGNVGIGTSSPAGYKLHVADGTPTVRISGTAETAGLSQYVTFGTPSYNRSAIQSTNVGTQGADLKFLTAPSGGNSTERMRIDSSGNLLVGTTDAAVGVGNTGTGLSFGNSGYAAVSRTGSPTQPTLFLNKNSNDGQILDFRKDGSTVGIIGSSTNIAGTFFIAGSSGLQFRSDDILPTNSSGVYSTGAVDLGDNGAKFRNLYLSGAGYVGTTQEANTALSGTTPSISAETAGSFTLTTSGNTTFTFAGVTSGRSVGFVLKLTAGGGHTITWPSSVDWAGGTAPDAPASGETDVLVFYTVDGGTNWYGVLSIDAAA